MAKMRTVMTKLRIRPCTFRMAKDYVAQYHRHHAPSVGCKFCISAVLDDRIVGVAICGRPVSRYLDDGFTLEINRLCTDGQKNACSILYGACVRIAKEMGYKKVITYILQSESGISLKASGFVCEGDAGGCFWTGKRTKDISGYPHERKTRWSKTLGV